MPRSTPPLLPLLGLALALAGCGWLWPRDNPRDPGRCDPGCSTGQVCWEGTCVSPDARGEAHLDAPRVDSTRDAGRDSTPDAQVSPFCPTPGWKTMTSSVTTNLEAVWGSSSQDVFAAGEKGTILHYDGSKWSAMSSGTTEKLHALWGTGASSVYAAGDNGTLLSYNGTSWAAAAQAPSTTLDLHAVWGSGSELFVVGEQGTIFRWDGSKWTTTTQGTQTLTSVYGTSKTDVLVAGGLEVYRFNGTAWSKLTTGASVNHRAMWGNGQALFVVGEAVITGGPPPASVELYQSSALTSMTTTSGAKPLNAVWGSLEGPSTGAPGDAFAVGEGGTVLYFDGSRWVAQQSGTSLELTGVWRSDDNQAFVVGKLGTILHHAGPWKLMPRKTTYNLAAVWGSGPQDLVAVGESGTVLRFDGTSFTPSSAGTNTLLDIWGDGSGVLYAVSSLGAVPATKVVRYASNQWSDFHPIDRFTTSIWGPSSTEIFVGGVQRVEQYNGSAWKSISVTSTLRHLWGRSATDIYGVGSQGAIEHYDGTLWTQETAFPTTEDLEGVTGYGSGPLTIVGAKGTVLRGTKGSFTKATSNVTVRLLDAWAAGANEVFAVGEKGAIIRWDGTSWTSTITGTTYWLSGIWGSGSKDVWAVGEGGTVLHWCGP